MRINISSSGFDSTIKALEGKKLISDNDISKVLDEVARRGTIEAQRRYNYALKDGNDTPTVTTVKTSENTREIVAKGEGVAFIEFGTGILNDEHPLQYEVEGIDPHGQYGWGQGANPEGWYYSIGRGVPYVHTTGIDAQRCLYDTGKELEQEIPQIIREVIK